ncbi:MAG: alpha/beta hydrolase [Chloroflexi bacterium]|nr:alpha/beta hydrolase [Chloroflexota bacterium]
MQTVQSSDGTRIAFERTGDGPPLVLVHGTSADHTRWAPVLPALNRHFSVYAMDRRGRGGSGDSKSYALEREFEDVAAVVDAIGEPVNLLGHSYGALCALEGARRTNNLRRLVLYEPPLPRAGVSVSAPEIVTRLEQMLAAGDREGVVVSMMRDVALVPPHELELLRSVPAWQARVAAAHTIPRELLSEDGTAYEFNTDHFRNFVTPTLLLMGSDSPAFLQDATRILHDVLPNNVLHVMPGQQHTAMNTAPDLFSRAVIEFLTVPSGDSV